MGKKRNRNNRNQQGNTQARPAPNGDRIDKNLVRVTVWGLQLKIKPEQLNDYEFMEALARLNDGDDSPLYVVRIVDTIAGNNPEVLAQIKATVRKRTGQLSSVGMVQFVNAVFKRISELSPNSSRSVSGGSNIERS